MGTRRKQRRRKKWVYRDGVRRAERRGIMYIYMGNKE